MAASKTTLLALPRELRNEIYSCLFSPPFPDSDLASLDPNTKPNGDSDTSSFFSTIYHPICVGHTFATILATLPPLCKTSWQLYYEATPIYLSTCTVVSGSRKDTEFLIDWLNSFSPCTFPSVRRLEFRRYAPDSTDITYALIFRCINLQLLRLGLHIPNLGEKKPTEWVVAETHNLTKILEIPKIERLELRLTNDDDCEFLTYCFLTNLEACFRMKWKEMGREVEIGTRIPADSEEDGEMTGVIVVD